MKNFIKKTLLAIKSVFLMVLVVRDLIIYKDLNYRSGREEKLSVTIKDMYLISSQKTKTTSYDSHYVYHTAWAARKLNENRPAKHIDIGSYHYFSTLVSAFIPVEFYDYRPMEIQLPKLITGSRDLTQLSFSDNSVKSLSCMHTIEHIGLGRYGDPVDPDGDLKAMNELVRVLSLNGYLYFVVPVGKPRICFNAHRIYDPTWVENYFTSRGLVLKDFSVVTDEGRFCAAENPINYRDQKYGCGCYMFQKVITYEANQ